VERRVNRRGTNPARSGAPTCSSLVSFESLKGMCCAPPSASLCMTVPSVSRLLLMKPPSTRCPLLAVARADSEPARSMRLSCALERGPQGAPVSGSSCGQAPGAVGTGTYRGASLAAYCCRCE
jgi:hypothetical protein